MVVSFKAFIQENNQSGSRYTSLNVDEAIDFLDKHCTKYLDGLKNGNLPLWRGDRRNPLNLSIGDSRNFKRTSANTSNWYNLFIDNSRKWKDYPPRLSSYICSTSQGYAKGYGAEFMVFPDDACKLGLTPAPDMWYSFEKRMSQILRHTEDVAEFQDLIFRIWSNYTSAEELSEDDATTLISQLKSVTLEDIKKIASTQTLVRLDGIAEGMEKNSCKNLYDVFDFVFDPTGNNFSHGDSALNTKESRTREVWVHGKCLFVKKYPVELEAEYDLAKITDYLIDVKNIPKIGR